MFAPSEDEPNLSTALQLFENELLWNHRITEAGKSLSGAVAEDVLFFISQHFMTVHLQGVCDSGTLKKKKLEEYNISYLSTKIKHAEVHCQRKTCLTFWFSKKISGKQRSGL